MKEYLTAAMAIGLLASLGLNMSAAIHAAARGGLIKELLIDEGGARSLLEFARQSAGGGEDASR